MMNLEVKSHKKGMLSLLIFLFSFVFLIQEVHAWYYPSWQYRKPITIQGYAWIRKDSNSTSVRINTTAGNLEGTQLVYVDRVSGPTDANLTVTYTNVTPSAAGALFDVYVNGNKLGTLTVPSSQTNYTFTNVSVNWLISGSNNNITFMNASVNLDSLNINKSILSYNISAVGNYQVAINLTYDSDMQPDFSDIRFTWYNASDGTETEIPYWVESKNDTYWAYFWVKVPSIPASSTTTTVYVYYGNTSVVSSQSNGDSTFLFFDDFIGSSLNSTKWSNTTVGQASISVSGGVATLTLLTGNVYGDYARILGNPTFLKPFFTKFRVKTTRDTSPAYYFPMAGLNSAGSGYAFFGYQSYLYWGDGISSSYVNIAHNGLVSVYKKDKITWQTDELKFYVEEALIATETTYIPANPITSFFDIYCDQASGCGSYTLDVDWVFIAKWVYPEPTYSVGAEEKENIPPAYSLNSTNATLAGTAVEHRLKWVDNVGLSGYIFSFDNCTGNLVNDTWVSMTGTGNWSNVTKTINSTVGCTIRWCVYANDTSGNWNGTSCQNPFTYTSSSVSSTLQMNATKVWWNDSVLASGYTVRNSQPANGTLNLFIGSQAYCSNVQVINGNWNCTFYTPLEIKSYTVTANYTDDLGNPGSNTTALTVSPFYGKRPTRGTISIIEQYVMIQDLNGRIKRVKLLLAVWR
jgi:hypothetical protein